MHSLQRQQAIDQKSLLASLGYSLLPVPLLMNF